MSLYAHQRSDNAKWVIAFVLIAVLLVGMVVMGAKLINDKTTEKVDAFDWEIGGIASDGDEAKNTGCIRLKESISVDGLEIKIADEADIKYSVFFYSVDEDGEETFIDSCDDLEGDFAAASIPEGAEVCRIVIEPTMDAEVGIFEINTYASQLSVVFNK